MDHQLNSFTTYDLVFRELHPELDRFISHIQSNEFRRNSSPWPLGSPSGRHPPNRNDRPGKRAVKTKRTNRSGRTVVLLLIDLSTFVRRMQEAIVDDTGSPQNQERVREFLLILVNPLETSANSRRLADEIAACLDFEKALVDDIRVRSHRNK